MLFSRTKRAVRNLRDEIDSLQAASGEQRSAEQLSRLRALRHELGEQLLAEAGLRPAFAEPDVAALAETDGVPEVAAEALTASLLRTAILSRGCLLVRGLVSADEAEAITREADRALEVRDSAETGVDAAAHYDEFEPGGKYGGFLERRFVAGFGGLWVGDSPRLMADVIELFDRAGLPRLIGEYLGEPPVISLHKWTLRKLDRAKVGWHQDGAFLGDVHTVNVWLALSRCGDEAPGLDLVPRRLEEIVPTGTEGAEADWSVSRSVAEQTAGETGVARPVFDPGDALLFDEMLLHGTAQDTPPGRVRYACETWFFGPSGFPPDYLPLAY